MKKTITIYLTFLLMFMMGCSNKKKDTVIWQVTDLHYLSPTLHDDGPLFQYIMLNGDGKISDYSELILDTLCEKAIAEKPDVLLLTGDLTFNGELQSLKELSEKLHTVTEKGIPVLVIPGNHDIDYPYANTYFETQPTKTEPISQKTFMDIMKEFGYEAATRKDSVSFSYVYELSDSLWLMAIDSNTEGMEDVVLTDTLIWMEDQLVDAKEQGVEVITFSHQNVLPQSILSEGYVLMNGDAVSSMLKKYNVKLNLSGHSHLQHTVVDEALTDICTESISLYPIQFSCINYDVENGSFTHTNKQLGILEKESYKRFEDIAHIQLLNTVSDEIPTEERNQMIDLGIKFHIGIFTNDRKLMNELYNSDAWKLWEKYEAGNLRFQSMYVMIQEYLD